MRSLSIAVFLIAIAPLGMAGPTACYSLPGNLVANCNFQDDNFTNWTLAGNDVPGELGNLYGVEGTDPVDGISPIVGTTQAYFSDLDANATTLSQTLTTVVGTTYIVSFYLAQDTAVVSPYSNEFSVSFGSTSLASLTAVAVEPYTLYQYTAIATSTSTVLSFTIGNDLGEFLLDDISVQTPEPSAWALALVGGLVCFQRRLRRKKH